MELELGLALSTSNKKKKRGLDDASMSLTTLPLFATTCVDDHGEEQEEGTADSDQLDQNPHTVNGGRRVVVGWPPVKRVRLHHEYVAGKGKAKCVKVKMEGVAIGRKVNLSLHRSYRELFNTLNEMFYSYHQDDNVATVVAGVRGSPEPRNLFEHRKVTYEDGEGDWMLVGDVPWEDFVLSVRRMKILN